MFRDNSPKKLSNFEILKAFFIGNTNTLRTNGYHPRSLYESSQLSFNDKQNCRARTQCRIMTRFTPLKSEAPIYEKSGDLLFRHDLPKQARQHWQIAFDNDHKPFDMTMSLGRHSLLQGHLDTACRAFGCLSKRPGVPYYVHNELGVAQFMLATQQSNPMEFVKRRLDALDSFDEASKLQADPVVTQNKKVASLLTSSPKYGHPWSYLEYKDWWSSTRMIDALMRDLSNHQEEYQSAPGVGIAVDGSSNIKPVITTASYTVPIVPNQLALCELAKIKQEQLSEEEISSRMKLSK